MQSTIQQTISDQLIIEWVLTVLSRLCDLVWITHWLDNLCHRTWPCACTHVTLYIFVLSWYSSMMIVGTICTRYIWDLHSLFMHCNHVLLWLTFLYTIYYNCATGSSASCHTIIGIGQAWNWSDAPEYWWVWFYVMSS